jgi:hypothetical protein
MKFVGKCLANEQAVKGIAMNHWQGVQQQGRGLKHTVNAFWALWLPVPLQDTGVISQ